MSNKPEKWALVSGAAGGIGSAAVSVFVKHGWHVVAVDRKEFTGVEKPDIRYIQADIANPDDIELIYKKTREITSTLDAVINNAAIQVSKPIIETSVEEWDIVMASNLRSVFLGAKLAYPLLKSAGGGAIVNVPLCTLWHPVKISAYAASKAGCCINPRHGN